MQVNKNICETLKSHLIKTMSIDTSAQNAIDYLFVTGIFDKKQVLRALVKIRYRELRKNNSHRSSVLDCAIEYGVSESMIEKCIYKRKDIKL